MDLDLQGSKLIEPFELVLVIRVNSWIVPLRCDKATLRTFFTPLAVKSSLR